MKSPSDAVSAAGRIDPIVDLLLTETRQVRNWQIQKSGASQAELARRVVAMTGDACSVA